MSRLFLLPGATQRDPAIDPWLDQQPEGLGVIARRWFERLRACGEDVRETLHDGHPTACIWEAAFAYVNVFTAHVNVGFFLGAELPDPEGLLLGQGKFMRHVKLRPDTRIDTEALVQLIEAAYVDMKRHLEKAS